MPQILSHFICGEGSKPRLQFLEYYGRFHRVSGERPRILLLAEQPSGCGVRSLRAQAHSVSACSLTVLHVLNFAGGEREELLPPPTKDASSIGRSCRMCSLYGAGASSRLQGTVEQRHRVHLFSRVPRRVLVLAFVCCFCRWCRLQLLR